MGLTNFPNGISSFGVPVLGGSGAIHTGNVFFVSSTSANADDDPTQGTTPDKPFATIDYAIGRCTDSTGDVIYVMPGHVEAISTAAGISIDKIGISIIGIGGPGGAGGTAGPYSTYYNLAPVVQLSAAAATVDVSANSCVIQNITFEATAADVAACIVNTSGQGLRILGCRFVENSALNFLVCYSGGTGLKSAFVEIGHCTAVCPDTANTHFALLPGTANGMYIHDNVLHGDWGIGAIGGTTNVTGVVTNITIARNLIYNAASTADACINLAATATGIVAYNACGGAHATDGINIGDCAGIENYYVQNALDTSAVLEPATA